MLTTMVIEKKTKTKKQQRKNAHAGVWHFMLEMEQNYINKK